MRMVIGSTTDPGIIRNYRCRPGLLGHTLVVAGGQGVGGRKWPQLSPDLRHCSPHTPVTSQHYVKLCELVRLVYKVHNY